MNPPPRIRLVAMVLASLILPPLAACRDAGSRGEAGAPSAGTPSTGAALNFDRLRCASRTGRRTCDLYNASVVELIANPREFHGKPVRVIGYLHIEPQADAIYLSETDYAHAIHRNGLWVNAPTGADSLSGGYVLVEATFDASSQGEFGKWSGTLKDVTALSRRAGRSVPPVQPHAPAPGPPSARSP